MNSWQSEESQSGFHHGVLSFVNALAVNQEMPTDARVGLPLLNLTEISIRFT